MKKFFTTSCILILLLIIVGNIAKSRIESDFSSYGVWNKSTKTILVNNFNGALPDHETAEAYKKDYYYSFSQAVLGDENFVIYIDLEMPNKEVLDDEIKKYQKSFTKNLFQNGESYYLIQCTQESIIDYCDNNVYDGMYYNFEMIVVNENSLAVRFLSAHVWDYYKDEMLIAFLQPLVGVEK